MKTVKTKTKMPVRAKVNVGIFVVVAIVFALMPKLIMAQYMEAINNAAEPQYAGQFTYILHDVCPCSESDDECAGYYACGPDKANITYNLDNAPEELLDAAKRDHYFEGMIESNRYSATAMRIYLQCDMCYLMAFISLVAGVIYWNHCKIKK